MAFRFRPVFGNGNLSPFFYQLYKFYLRTVKYRYEFVHCHVAMSSVKLAANSYICATNFRLDTHFSCIGESLFTMLNLFYAAIKITYSSA